MQKTVFITGSSSGIGKASVKYFAQKGWNVAATMRDPSKEKELNTLENVVVVVKLLQISFLKTLVLDLFVLSM